MFLRIGLKSGRTARRRPRSLAWRMALWYTASSSLLLLIAGALFYGALLASLRHESEDLLGEHIALIRAHLHDTPSDITYLWQLVAAEPAGRKYHRVYTRIIGPLNQPVVQTPGMEELLPPGSITMPPDPDPPFNT